MQLGPRKPGKNWIRGEAIPIANLDVPRPITSRAKYAVSVQVACGDEPSTR